MDEDSRPRRLLIKISGEALKGTSPAGLSVDYLSGLGNSIRELCETGYEIALVIGGGNFFRGNLAPTIGLNQSDADQMGMLATVMNGIALHTLFLGLKLPAVHVSAYSIAGLVEPLSPSDCRQLLAAGNILIFSAGLGRPFFTTDTAAVSRSLEIGAQLLVKGTKVDGVYSADPCKDPDAKRFRRLSYREVLQNRLQIMDQTAFTLAQEHNLPIKVIDITDPSKLKIFLEDPETGTIIS